jgi:hypothetical protein
MNTIENKPENTLENIPKNNTVENKPENNKNIKDIIVGFN